MGLRDKLRKLEAEAEREIVTLICQECSQELRVRHGAELDLVADAWAEGMRDRGHEVQWETPEDVRLIRSHPHSELSLINKPTGEPLFPWGAIYEK
jgi:hypothetical protein